MVTKYVKVKMQLLDSNGDKVKINKEFMSNWANSEFNKHILFYSLIPEVYETSGVIMQEDLLTYVYPEEDKISDKIKCMIPSFLFAEDPIPLSKVDTNNKDQVAEWFNGRYTREYELYLYVKVDIAEDLTEEELSNLYKYLSGQMSDGWGEGFEQREFTLTRRIEDEKGESTWSTDSYSVSYILGSEMQFVDEVQRY